MAHDRSSAVVLGASISGLLAARALGGHFDRVTVVERDNLPDDPCVRKGVPQSSHAHGLLASGYRVIDGYFPGLMDELEGLGAPRGDVTGDFLWFQYGRWKLRRPSGLRGITVSRPCLEHAIRRRVKALERVSFLESVEVLHPVFDSSAGRVTGLAVRGREALPADLVVDASGRGSQSPTWLEEWGFARPEEVVIRVNVGYATRIFERRRGEFFSSMGGVVGGVPPESRRYAAVLAAEGNRWIVTLVGALADYPPAKEKEWVDFAASLPSPAVHELVTSVRPLTDIVTYRFHANQRRLYERMERFPAGYLVVGDALCSFNPIYGQGMSVAAAEAAALEECIKGGRDRLAQRFYARASKIIDVPWIITTGEDLRFPEVQGARPAGFRLMNRYFDRIHAVASKDAAVCRQFFEVLNLLAPPASLMSPRIAWRVLSRPVPQGPGSPLGDGTYPLWQDSPATTAAEE